VLRIELCCIEVLRIELCCIEVLRIELCCIERIFLLIAMWWPNMIIGNSVRRYHGCEEFDFRELYSVDIMLAALGRLFLQLMIMINHVCSWCAA